MNGQGTRSSEPRASSSAPVTSSATPVETSSNAVERRSTPVWRTLDELADDPTFARHLENEFPSAVEAITDPVARRTFLKLMGASLGLAGLTACTRQPSETIVPYVRQPEDVVPGRPLFFATAMTLGGVATGLLVESHEGRPTKIEGNPLHPGSVGASDVFAQAAVLGLYDPDRSQTLTNVGEIRPWSAFLAAIRAALVAQQPLKGAGLRLLTESVGSPTLAAQIRELLGRFPSAKWHQWDPASRDNARAGAKLAFGEYVDARYQIDRADVIVAFDSDWLGCSAGALRYARDFAARRRPDTPAMNRLYAFETMPTGTGSRADHRFPLKPGEIERAVRALGAALGVGRAPGQSPSAPDPALQKAIDAIARDLSAHRGAGIVIAGDSQPPAVHALVHAINETLGNVGRTVTYAACAEAEPTDQLQSLRDLVADMNGGRVDVLVIIGGNPVYTAPVDLKMAEAMAKVNTRVHLSLYDDETSELCHWQIPEAHFLEAWSDARAYDGTVSIVQPLIAPLYNGKSAHELLAAMSDRPERAGYEIVREYWNGQSAASPPSRTPPSSTGKIAPEFDARWRRWLHDGIVAGTALPSKPVTVRPGSWNETEPSDTAAGNRFDVVFRTDPSILDGRFANNGWLQELPKPLSRLTWDNAVFVSPRTAERLSIANVPSWQGGEHGQIVSTIVEIRAGGRALRGPIFPLAGHPDDCATVHLGYGRTRAGRVGTGAGFNANAIRTSGAMWVVRGAEIASTRDSYSLACTQYHHLMEGRGMVRAATREEFARNPKSVHEGFEEPPRTLTLYPNYRYEGYKWGMAIDVNSCIGCNACVIGCQAENNIAVIGKDQVLRGREMHWIRVDTYYRGTADRPETYFQPVPCMQCENAPCEPVCPVGATVHSHEGLNDMVYNRCVGTRYCSNNCPYKVRRFNFYLYSDWSSQSLYGLRNPDVTVRSRGVMEKCTYCVQRINKSKIESEKEDRRIHDGEVVTACQQVCPTQAIVFGDLNDAGSRVAKLKADPRHYVLLDELNTRPRTTYLARVRNVNPDLEKA